MKDQLAKGLMWLTAAKFCVNMLTFASTLVLARLLTPEDFGLVALATTMLTIVGSMTDLSLASALIHHRSPSDRHFSTAWTLNLGRALVIGTLFCVAAPFVASTYEEPRLRDIMLALGVSIVISGLSNPKIVALTKKLIFWQEFALTVSQKVAGFLVGISVALIYQTYWALVAATLASQLTGVVLSYVVMPFRPRFSLHDVRALWSFSIWLTLGKVVNTLNFRLDHLLVGTYIGRPALGFYSVGDNIAAMPTREVVGPIESTLFPGFAQIAHDAERLRRAYRSAQTLLTAIALPLGFGVALLAHPLVLLTMGEKWLPAVQVIHVLACVFAMQTMCSPLQPLAMALGQTKMLFTRDLFTFSIRVPLVVGGMFLGGLTGVIFGRVIANVVGICVNMMMVKRLIDTPMLAQLSANWRSIVATLSMVIGVIGVQRFTGVGETTSALILRISISIAVGLAIYVAGTLVLWRSSGLGDGPEREMLRMARKLIDKARRRN
jgi:lipopolysaccharide exporter